MDYYNIVSLIFVMVCLTTISFAYEYSNRKQYFDSSQLTKVLKILAQYLI
jgi:hypothetical protein